MIGVISYLVFFCNSREQCDESDVDQELVAKAIA